MRYQEHSEQHIRKTESDSRTLNLTSLIQPLKNDVTFLVCIRIVQEVLTVFAMSYLNDRPKYLFVSLFIRS